MEKSKKNKSRTLTKDERLDQLVDKIKLGVQESFRRFLKDAVKNNKKLVTKRNGKLVLVPASKIKIS
jgi:hypothetical protein